MLKKTKKGLNICSYCFFLTSCVQENYRVNSDEREGFYMAIYVVIIAVRDLSGLRETAVTDVLTCDEQCLEFV